MNDSFESWFLHRVAQAVEAGEVSVDLLTELQAEFDAAKERPQEEAHAAALRDIADTMGISLEQTEQGLRAIQAQPAVTREVLMRRIAEAKARSDRVGMWVQGNRYESPRAFRRRMGISGR